jgi:elongator complex protein 3
MLEKFSVELAEYILSRERSETQINNKKISLCKKYSLQKIPLNSEILSVLPEKIKEKISEYLVVKTVRSKAGENVIAVMCPPHKCPHGKCIYCPGD